MLCLIPGGRYERQVIREVRGQGVHLVGGPPEPVREPEPVDVLLSYGAGCSGSSKEEIDKTLPGTAVSAGAFGPDMIRS